MEKEKLKLIVRNLRLLVDALESEVYSDVKSYTSRLEETLPPLPDYDEVFEDDEWSRLEIQWRQTQGETTVSLDTTK